MRRKHVEAPCPSKIVAPSEATRRGRWRSWLRTLFLWGLVAAGGLATSVPAAHAVCTPSSTRLCLLGGQFSATLRWNDGGPAGLRDAFVAGPKTDASGLFYFFGADPDNWEILVKLIDGCLTNGRYWVLVSASTGFQWQLTVVNENNGATRTFSHPLDGNASGIADFNAFVCNVPPAGARVRYLNDLICLGSPFTSTLSANGFQWTSVSGVPTNYLNVNRTTLGPFTEVNNSPCPNLGYPGTFNISPGRRYLLRQTISGSTPVLQLFDEGSALVLGEGPSGEAGDVVQELQAAPGEPGGYELVR